MTRTAHTGVAPITVPARSYAFWSPRLDRARGLRRHAGQRRRPYAPGPHDHPGPGEWCARRQTSIAAGPVNPMYLIAWQGRLPARVLAS